MKEEYFCKVYKDYKISVPVNIRKLLSIIPNDEIVFKVTNDNKVVLNTVSRELLEIQKDMKKFFANKPIVNKFLAKKGNDYDD